MNKGILITIFAHFAQIFRPYHFWSASYGPETLPYSLSNFQMEIGKRVPSFCQYYCEVVFGLDLLNI